MELRPLPSLAGGGEVWSPSPVSTNATSAQMPTTPVESRPLKWLLQVGFFFFFNFFGEIAFFLKVSFKK